MNEPTTQQIERLPKWAQEHIERLERQVKDLTQANIDLQQDEPTQIYWTSGHREDKKYIPNNARIYIERGGEHRTLMVHWDNVRKMLNVAAEFSALLVRPHSSNWIHVEAEKR
jgi:hypothetical protein